MEMNEFIEKFSQQFENIDVKDLDESTHFKEFDEWSSLIALYIISMVDEEYNVALVGEEIQRADTIGDIYNIVQRKLIRQ